MSQAQSVSKYLAAFSSALESGAPRRLRILNEAGDDLRESTAMHLQAEAAICESLTGRDGLWVDVHVLKVEGHS